MLVDYLTRNRAKIFIKKINSVGKESVSLEHSLSFQEFWHSADKNTGIALMIASQFKLRNISIRKADLEWIKNV